MSGSPPAIPASRFAERLRSIQAAGADEGVAAIMVGVGADLEWLIGYAATGLERLNLLIVPPRGRPKLIVPRLEVGAVQAAPGVAPETVGGAATCRALICARARRRACRRTHGDRPRGRASARQNGSAKRAAWRLGEAVIDPD